MDSQQRSTVFMEAYDAAPPYIQDFVASGKFDVFMAGLQSKFTLHADVANAVSNEILMMILGITAPAEFVDALTDGTGVTEDQVGPIVEAINKEVFVPLQEQTRAQRVTDTPAVAPPPPAPVYVAPAPPTPPLAPVQPVAPPIPEVPIAPTMRTMATDVEQINGGSAPAPRPYAAPGAPSVPVPPPAPAPVEPFTQVAPAPTAPILPHRERSTTPTPSREEVTDTLKKYGIDPYREIV